LPRGEKTARVDQAIRDLLDRLSDGEQLPTERDLAEQFGTSRSTVRTVLARLDTEGLIWAEHGHGTFARRTGRQEGEQQ
jgi:DNA-binding FadR family transcriptional regulator